MKRLITLFALTLFAQAETRFPVRLQLPDYGWGMSIIRSYDIDLLGVDYQNKMVEVLVSEMEMKILADYFISDLGMKSSSGYSDYYSTMFTEVKPDEKYKNPQEIEAILMDYAERFPKIARLEVIGESLEGRNIYAMKISDNVHRRELSEPTILFNGNHHARELMTPEVALDIIDRLLNGYWKNFKITKWVKSNEIWVVPMVNPDGNNRIWIEDKWWRKNTRDNQGVDLNRNYPFGWGSCDGSSGNPKSGTYRGTHPASEPETQTIMALVERIRPVFDISYHAFSELVIYPYGCEGEIAEQIVQEIGAELGERLDYKAGTGWDLLYSVDGSDIDWMYGEYQVIPFVIELNRMSEGFQPTYDLYRDVTVERNRAGWSYLLDRLDGPGVRGIVTDKNKNVLSEFSVEVEERIDGEYQWVKSYRGNPDGTYHIVLGRGKYRLTYSAPGFSDITKKIRVGSWRKNRNIRFN